MSLNEPTKKRRTSALIYNLNLVCVKRVIMDPERRFVTDEEMPRIPYLMYYTRITRVLFDPITKSVEENKHVYYDDRSHFYMELWNPEKASKFRYFRDSAHTLSFGISFRNQGFPTLKRLIDHGLLSFQDKTFHSQGCSHQIGLFFKPEIIGRSYVCPECKIQVHFVFGETEPGSLHSF